MKGIKHVVVLVIVALLSCSATLAADLFVSLDARQSNADGSIERPYSSLEDALRKARELRRLNDESIQGGINIFLEEGVYRPDQRIVFRPEDAGTANSPTRILPLKGQRVKISGGRPIKGWQPLKSHPKISKEIAKHVLVADAPKVGGKSVNFRQLWVNNKKAQRAESHKDNELPRIINWNFERASAVIPNDFKGLEFTPGMEFFIHQWWAIAQLRVKDATIHQDSIELFFYEPESKIQNEHPWPKPWLSEEHGNSAFRLVNALAFLDSPGEWFLDEDAGKIYYYKRPGEEASNLQAEFPYLENVLTLKGTKEQPVEHIHFQDIDFVHSAWNRPNTHGHVALQAGMYFYDAYKLDIPGTLDKAGLENQAWVGRPGAAVFLENTKHIEFQGCEFLQVAATALDFDTGNKEALVKGCVFKNIGGNALLVGKFSDESFEAHLPYHPVDAREITEGIKITNNLIHNAANEDWGAVGIGVGFARGIEVSNNDISELSYTGISLGWGWTPTVNMMRDNKISDNKITRYGKYMYDVAGIYTLSAQPGTKITGNLIDSIYLSPYAHIPDHWFYLYTDEGSAYMQVENNWFPEEKILKNANGPAVIWQNNGPQTSKEELSAGLQQEFYGLLQSKDPVQSEAQFNAYVPFLEPVYVQVYDPNAAFSKEDFSKAAKEQGIDNPEIYSWGSYHLLKTDDELGKKLLSALLANNPQLESRLFNDLVYEFDRGNCKKDEPTGEEDFVLLSAQLVDDESLQDEYLQYHQDQFEEWPEVAQGFCKAGFNQVLVYKSGRQLMLYISFEKGKDFQEIDKLTTLDNPRVEEWNELMSSYQEGIKGTDKSETWIFFKR